MKSYGVHWFRRDLRVRGNPALRWSHNRYEGRVLGLFCFDDSFLSRPDFSHVRFAFFLKSLKALQEELRTLGGDLLVINRPPKLGIIDIMKRLQKSRWGGASSLSYNRDYEPFARHRDEKVSRILKESLEIEVHTDRDHLLFEPGEIMKLGSSDGNNFYQIYTPFAKRWFDRLREAKIQQRFQGISDYPNPFDASWSKVLGAGVIEDQLDYFIEKNRKQVQIAIPAAGNAEALSKLRKFKDQLSHYKVKRDLPAAKGTSGLSLFLKNGSLTILDVIREFGLESQQFSTDTSKTKFLKELVWREFYYHILWHCPRVENEAFISKFNKIEWENNVSYFEAWKKGQTGYPLVDAGMRELNETGTMHNRVRMVVASFLTKDLLIDWRWGERYFMEKLLDGDLASNNGGWQWAASTGCDPQPYFRIFNPVLQSQKFDPSGDYIRKWVPEAVDLTGSVMHEPREPIVDHAQRKVKALKMYSV